jgi:SAM-dependent methyltransferase
MKVSRDFEALYRAEADPWNIGSADSDRYERYLAMALPFAGTAVLDIGCGFGAFLSRFRGSGAKLHGVELSETAIAKGRDRFPFIEFHAGSAAAPDRVQALAEVRFDLIVCSDVIYYLDDREKIGLLDWINRHLTDDGKALIAAWCPGGQYLTPSEFGDYATGSLLVDCVETFDSGHVAMLASRRRTLVALTFDYETWQPIPDGKQIDWAADIFEPTDRLLAMLGRSSAVATFFVEMGEYFWLEERQPDLARRMEDQLRQIAERGHDVQLHLHTSWLPELGADCRQGVWTWDWAYAKAADYPGDLNALIGRCKERLEEIIKPVRPDYSVTSFRAGAYQAQPFERLGKALIAHGLIADSSVYSGGLNTERQFDYRNAYSRCDPYFADLLDPQLKAVPSEEVIVELPIFTPEPGRRWFVDGNEGPQLASRLRRFEEQRRHRPSLRTMRFRRRVRELCGMAYSMLGGVRSWVNRLLPKALVYRLIAHHYGRPSGHGFYVAIGHTKTELRYADIESNILAMRTGLGVEFVGMSDMARLAHAALSTGKRGAAQELEHQVERESSAILSEQRNEAQSFHLQDMVPLDCTRVLDFGCGAGYWSARIAALYPWMSVIGIDGGQAFIDKANDRYVSDRVSFRRADFLSLPFDDESFDCVYADNTIEHSFDVQATLDEICRVLKPGRSLVAALPLDALNPDSDCDNHTWKTTESQVRLRLERSGFEGLECHVLDTFRQLGMPPFPPSNDKMLYVRAWKRREPGGRLARVAQAMDWLYGHVHPGQGNVELSAARILTDGHALCVGYAVTLLELLRREGFDVELVTMEAENHPRGRGSRSCDSHQAVELRLDGRTYLLDPTANVLFPHGIESLLDCPALAEGYASGDERWAERRYDLYAGPFWYERVIRYARRRRPGFPVLRWRRPGKSRATEVS